MNDLISRQVALETAHLPTIEDAGYEVIRLDDILALPSAQPEADEWCHDCKEYDKDHHCCPRWNRVIKTTLAEAQHVRADSI